MSEDIPTFRVELVACGAAYLEMTRWCMVLEKMKPGDPLIYMVESDRLAMQTITLKPCGFAVDPELLRYIHDGVEFSATRDTYEEIPEGNAYHVVVMVIFRPSPSAREGLSVETRESVDA